MGLLCLLSRHSNGFIMGLLRDSHQMVLSRCELLLGNGNYQLVLYYFIGLDGEPV